MARAEGARGREEGGEGGAGLGQVCRALWASGTWASTPGEQRAEEGWVCFTVCSAALGFCRKKG